METTAHKPYANYKDGDVRPILAYELVDGSKRVPLVPGDDGELVRADEFGEYEITAHKLKEEQRKMLHG